MITFKNYFWRFETKLLMAASSSTLFLCVMRIGAGPGKCASKWVFISVGCPLPLPTPHVDFTFLAIWFTFLLYNEHAKHCFSNESYGYIWIYALYQVQETSGALAKVATTLPWGEKCWGCSPAGGHIYFPLTMTLFSSFCKVCHSWPKAAWKLNKRLSE